MVTPSSLYVEVSSHRTCAAIMQVSALADMFSAHKFISLPRGIHKGTVRTITLCFCCVFTYILTIITLQSSIAITSVTDEVRSKIKKNF